MLSQYNSALYNKTMFSHSSLNNRFSKTSLCSKYNSLHLSKSNNRYSNLHLNQGNNLHLSLSRGSNPCLNPSLGNSHSQGRLLNQGNNLNQDRLRSKKPYHRNQGNLKGRFSPGNNHHKNYLKEKSKEAQKNKRQNRSTIDIGYYD